MFRTNTEDGNSNGVLQDGIHTEGDAPGQSVDTTSGFFRVEVEGSTSTDTDENWENWETKTDENKVLDRD